MHFRRLQVGYGQVKKTLKLVKEIGFKETRIVSCSDYHVLSIENDKKRSNRALSVYSGSVWRRGGSEVSFGSMPGLIFMGL